jgi:hypothetical protein
MTLRRVVTRFSSAESQALDELRGRGGPPSSLIRVGSLDELRGKGLSRASLIRAAVRVLLDGTIAPAVILGHVRAIRREKRAAAKRRPAPAGAPSVRRRVVEVIEAQPDEVFTPPEVARIVGGRRDTVRNALLALAASGMVEKLGVGEYRARARALPRRPAA